MVLCLLATDDEEDVALQIHFTLIQAFCCENDINILRVSNMRRLAEILGGVKPGGEPLDLHCVLVTVSVITHRGLAVYCSLPLFQSVRNCFYRHRHVPDFDAKAFLMPLSVLARNDC